MLALVGENGDGACTCLSRRPGPADRYVWLPRTCVSIVPAAVIRGRRLYTRGAAGDVHGALGREGGE